MRENNIKLREEVEVFAKAMEKKLRQNKHKGGWQRCGFDYLTRRLQEEVDEAKISLISFLEHKIDSYEVEKELADVANFLLMINDNVKTFEKLHKE